MLTIMPKEKRKLINFNDEIEVFVKLSRYYDRLTLRWENLLTFHIEDANILLSAVYPQEIKTFKVSAMCIKTLWIDERYTDYIYIVDLEVQDVQEERDHFEVLVSIKITRDPLLDFFSNSKRTVVIDMERKIVVTKKESSDCLRFDFEEVKTK